MCVLHITSGEGKKTLLTALLCARDSARHAYIQFKLFTLFITFVRFPVGQV